MKKRAFLVQISGLKYESFLPDYIFFSHTAYPDTTVIVLHEDDLNNKTKRSLDFLQSIGCKIMLIKTDFMSYLKMNSSFWKKNIYKTTGVFKCCGRFLIDIPEFHNFDEIYIGDVDLFIMKEDTDLFEQHFLHSRFLGLPYSDILREPFYFKMNLKKKIRALIKFGPIFYRNKTKCPDSFYINKMTGLRYIQVQPYFDAVSKHFKEFINLFDNLFLNGHEIDKEEIITAYSFDDQQIVCLLMKKAFGILPKYSTGDGIDVHNPLSFDYRPHHGIHIKLFLNSKMENCRIVKSGDYSNYLSQYKLILDDPNYVKLSCFRFGFCKKLTKNLKKYIEKHNL